MPEQEGRGPLVDGDLDAIAVLHEPLRRSLYRYVAGRDDDVSRDEAAAAVGDFIRSARAAMTD